MIHGLKMWGIIFLWFAGAGVPSDKEAMLREEMVRSQLLSRGITSKEVLEAFRKVPRHLFVPLLYRPLAYADQPLPIGEGQTISQPYIVAYMTETLGLRPEEKVLEVGTGSGYQAAILAEMDIAVYSIELLPSLLENARKVLTSLGYLNIHLKSGNGYRGWEEYAPFDGILVTCAPAAIPPALKEQLAEGGRMVIPVGDQGSVQYLYLLEKQNGRIRQKNILPVRFVPMVDEKGKPY